MQNSEHKLSILNSAVVKLRKSRNTFKLLAQPEPIFQGDFLKNNLFEVNCVVVINEPFDFRSASGELVLPEIVDGVLDELDERDQQTPGMRTQGHQTLEQNAGDLLLEIQMNKRSLKEENASFENIHCAKFA